MICHLDRSAAFAVGAKQQGIYLRMPCPLHGGSRGDALQLSEAANGAAVWHCHGGCDKDNVRDALIAAGILKVDGTTKPPTPSNSKRLWMSKVWSESVSIASTDGEKYLVNRGIDMRRLPTELIGVVGSLTWHPQMKVLVGVVTLGGKKVGVTIGRPAACMTRMSERKFHGPIKGGAVRLIGPVGGRLAIAEGIETALAFAALTGMGAWSALSAGGMAALDINDLPTDMNITIAADFDGAGITAAETLKRRLQTAGIPARIRIPRRYQTDWLDELVWLADSVSPSPTTTASRRG